jgi:ubiquinone biosynthesis protein COQ4
MTTILHGEHDEARGHSAGHIDEAEAVRVALSGSAAQRRRVAARSLLRLLRNTHDTTQVFILGIVVNARHVGPLLERFDREGGDRLRAEQASLDSRSVDFDALRRLPADSLGGAYARYLDENGLDPDLFTAPPGVPEEVRYLAQRIRQTHDLWHVLTGYRPDVPGELALQAFTYAQLGMPSAKLIATFGTLFRSPWTLPAVLDGYARGRAARFLATVRFEDHFSTPLADVRVRLGIRPKHAAAFMA